MCKRQILSGDENGPNRETYKIFKIKQFMYDDLVQCIPKITCSCKIVGSLANKVYKHVA